MASDDDLNTPLGQDKGPGNGKAARRLPVSAPQVIAGALGLAGVTVVGWAMVVNDPLGGEPRAVVVTRGLTIDSKAETKTEGGAAEPVARHDGAASKAAAEPATPPIPPGARTVTIIDGSSGKRQDIVIPGTGVPLPPQETGAGKADAKRPDTNKAEAAKPSDPAVISPPANGAPERTLLDSGRHGMIPKIGPDGSRPSVVYARPRTIPANRKDYPRIAIIVTGLGISASGTADAFSSLPGPVTFALAPYAVDVEKLATQARTENHEVLLQVPMEPFDYPDNDPGPQTLLTALNAEQNMDRLQWLMSRFQGYVGLINYMGGKYTASEATLGPVLRESGKRGLLYVDDGTSNRSVAGQVAGGQSLPFARADIQIDAMPASVEIDRALSRLELIARENGTAVGVASGQPATVARIAEWAMKVESRGFVLVPISMVAGKPKST